LEIGKMSKSFVNTDEFRGAVFKSSDLREVEIRDCFLTDGKIVGSVVNGLRISGHAGRAEQVFVDDVEVTAFVASELDKRFPERVRLREISTADDHRALWRTIDELWSTTIERAGQLPDEKWLERVDGEFSFAETLRHLVFAIDVWVGRMLLGESMPFHAHGLPPTDYPDERTPEIGIDLSAQPSYAEVLETYHGRHQQVSDMLASLTDAQLEEDRTASPAPNWGVETHSVRSCWGVVFDEHIEHRRFAVRDLAVLEQQTPHL
jgi:uncharacterized damage-inducible protein DinB